MYYISKLQLNNTQEKIDYGKTSKVFSTEETIKDKTIEFDAITDDLSNCLTLILLFLKYVTRS